MLQPSRLLQRINLGMLLVLGVLYLIPGIQHALDKLPRKPSPYQSSSFDWPAGTVTARCVIYPDDPDEWHTNEFKMHGTLDEILSKIHELQGYEPDDVEGRIIFLRRANTPGRKHSTGVEVFPDPPPPGKSPDELLKVFRELVTSQNGVPDEIDRPRAQPANPQSTGMR